MTATTADSRITTAVTETPDLPMDKKDESDRVFSRLLDYMTGGENKGRFFFGMILRIISLLGLIALPTITGQALNTVSDPNGSVEQLTTWYLMALIATAIYLGLSFFAERIFSDLATKGLYNVQTALFDHIQTLSLSFFDRQPVGQLMSRVTNDLEAVALFYETVVAQIIRAVFQILLIMIVMFYVNWRLAVAALTIVPVMLIITWVVQHIAAPAFAKMQDNMGNLSGYQEESISGHKAIISNRRQKWAGDANAQLAEDVYDVGKRAFFTSLMQIPLTNALIIIQIVIVLVVGAFLTIDGLADIGTIIAFTGYAALLSGPLSDIASLISTALNAGAGGRRVFEIMDE
jgi:ATP-binding cassette subfamily B protein